MTNTQHNFKVGDRVKCVKFTHSFPSRYEKFIGNEFNVVIVSENGLSINDPDDPTGTVFLYFDEVELIKDAQTIQDVVNVVPSIKKNHAWAVVNKATGEVEWIRMTRRSARSMVAILKDTESNYKVKKIEYDFT